jgi:hypothetical protein
MQLGTPFRKAAKNDLSERGRSLQRIKSRRDRDPRGAIAGKMIDAGGNGGKSDRAEIMASAKTDRAGVARGKMSIFPAPATMPDRADGMDHMFGLQSVPAGDLGVARLAAAECAAFVKQFGPRCAMDGAVNAAATQQGRIGGVDDGVNAQRRDVCDDDF